MTIMQPSANVELVTHSRTQKKHAQHSTPNNSSPAGKLHTSEAAAASLLYHDAAIIMHLAPHSTLAHLAFSGTYVQNITYMHSHAGKAARIGTLPHPTTGHTIAPDGRQASRQKFTYQSA